MAEEYFFYRAFPSDSRTRLAIDPKFRWYFWKPRYLSVKPAGVPFFPFIIWWLFHTIRVFWNRDYSVFLIFDGDRAVHRSLITPGYIRFPFMKADDMQIGDTWTDPAYRGLGLATFALQEILRASKPGRAWWYIVEKNNKPSIRAAEKAGFTRAADGRRTTRYGLRILGSFVATSD